MIKAIRVFDCMLQKMMLGSKEKSKVQRKDRKLESGTRNDCLVFNKNRKPCSYGGPYSVSLCINSSSLLLLFSKVPEKGFVALLYNSCLPCDGTQRRNWEHGYCLQNCCTPWRIPQKESEGDNGQWGCFRGTMNVHDMLRVCIEPHTELKD